MLRLSLLSPPNIDYLQKLTNILANSIAGAPDVIFTVFAMSAPALMAH